MPSTLNSISIFNNSTFQTANVLNFTGDITCSVSGNVVTLYGGTNKYGPPVGSVVFFAAATVPAGYLECNGATVSRAIYSDLFKAIGTTFGAGDGINTFCLPDLRGEFIRGWDHGRGIDNGRVFGSLQQDDFSGTAITPIPSGTGSFVLNARVGSETKPRNVALLPCICVFPSLDPGLDVNTIANNKINKPSTASNGQVLTFSGGQWIASTHPASTVSIVQEPAVGFGQRGRESYGLSYYTQNQVYFLGRTYFLDNADTKKFVPVRGKFLGNYLAKNPTVTVSDTFFSLWNAFVLLSDGTFWGCGTSSSWQTTFTSTGRTGSFVRISVPGNRLVRSFSAACNDDTSFSLAVLCTDNTAWICGTNGSGQLGNGGTTASPSFVQLLVAGKTITQVSVSYLSDVGGNTLVLCNDGTVYGTGYNGYGALGIGNTTNQNVLTQCKTGASTFVTNVTRIIETPQGSAYNRYLIRTAASGGHDELLSTGLNDVGQLGITGTPSGTNVNFFTLCSSLPTTNTSGGLFKIKKIIQTGRSTSTTMCLLEDIVNGVGGRVYTWGYAAHGQMGLGVATANNAPQQVTVFQSTPSATASLPQIRDIAGGSQTGAGCLGLISTSKDLYVAGYRSCSPVTLLRTPTTYNSTIFYRFELAPVSNVEEVRFWSDQTDNQGCYVRDSDGVIWGWGYSSYGLPIEQDGVYVLSPQRLNLF